MKEEAKKRRDSYDCPRSSSFRKGVRSPTSNGDYDRDSVHDDDDDDDSTRVDEKEEQMKLVVQMAVRAGFLLVAGLSLCFSTFFIPGVVPFLGGLLCGVSLIEPPPLPGDYDKLGTFKPNDGTSSAAAKAKKYREREIASRSGGDNGVVKQMLMNMIDHFF